MLTSQFVTIKVKLEFLDRALLHDPQRRIVGRALETKKSQFRIKQLVIDNRFGVKIYPDS